MNKKRTFGQLKEGCYFYSASTSGVSRYKVFYHRKSTDSLGKETGTLKMGISWYTIEELDPSATEHHRGNIHWFTAKEDAQKCAYQQLVEYEKEETIRLNNLRGRLNYLKELWHIS
jgi:hypothetical protein